MSEWKEYSLEEIAVINPTEKLSKGSVAKKVTMDLLNPYTRKVQGFSNEAFLGGSKFRNGDTLVARITPCLENGKTAYVDILDDDNEVAFGSTEFIVIREKKGLSDKKFLYYFSISSDFRDVAILSMTGSSGRQRVETDVVKGHKFLFPPLSEQQSIASILSSLDDKIDLLHRQNKTLEAMAETLFRKWFVEEAKEEWEVGTLANEFDFVMGQSPSGETLNEEKKGIIFFQGRSDFGFRFPIPRVYTTTPTRLAKKFDTLISVRAPVGDMNIAQESCCLGRGVAAFRYKTNGDYYSYTYYKLRSLMNEIKQFEDNGTVFGSIGKDDFITIEKYLTF